MMKKDSKKKNKNVWQKKFSTNFRKFFLNSLCTYTINLYFFPLCILPKWWLTGSPKSGFCEQKSSWTRLFFIFCQFFLWFFKVKCTEGTTAELWKIVKNGKKLKKSLVQFNPFLEFISCHKNPISKTRSKTCSK